MLLWLTLGTRPDILFATIALSMYSVKPARRHRKGLERILGYLKRTPEKGIAYCDNPNPDPVVFTDAAYANDQDNRRSWSKQVGFVYGRSVSWRASRQRVVAQSSTEAEYIGAADAAR
jgi:hypothetical protein